MASFSIVNRSPDNTSYFAQDSIFNWTACYIVEMVNNPYTYDFVTLQMADTFGGGFGTLYFRLYGNFSFTSILGSYGNDIPAVAAGSIIERVDVIDASGKIYDSFTGLNFAFNTDKTSTAYDDANVFANSFRPGESPLVASAFSGNDYVEGSQGSEVLHGYGGNDTLLGFGGTDALYGDAGNDSLVGGLYQPNDLYGGDGNDTISGYTTGDYIDGGSGTDTWAVQGTYSTGIGLSPDLDLRGASVQAIEVLQITYGNIVVNETQVGGASAIQTVVAGSQYRDVLVIRATDDGSATGRVVNLSTVSFQNWNQNIQDNDQVRIEGSWNGGDTLIGGSQADFVNAGAGNNLVQGNGGNDYIYAFDGADTLRGDDGADTVSGGAGNDSLVGGAGDDSLQGADGNDTLEGDSSTATYYLVTGSDRLYGGTGNDLLLGGFGANTIDGGDGSDTVSYRNANPGSAYEVFRLVVDLSQPVDLATNNYAYNGTLTYREPNGIQDEVWVGDKILNVEHVEGSDYEDFITGDAAANRLSGWAGNDWLNGGNGNDTLDGGAGDDGLDGGLGFDLASYAAAGAGVKVDLGLAGWQNTGGAGWDQLTGIEGVVGSASGDTLTGDAQANLLQAGSGNDVLRGGAGDDTLDGGKGADRVIYADAVAGVSVSLAIQGAQNTGGDGLDTLLSIERLTGSAFADRLDGNSRNNILSGGDGADTLNGAAGNDSLEGGLAADVLKGGSGADTLRGGAGADTLTGGQHADVFRFDTKDGLDRVTDFTSGVDRVQIVQSGFTVGDGDLLLEGVRTVSGPGGFGTTAELVVVTADMAGALGKSAAAAAIGSATSAYAIGASALFAVDNGTSSALYLFRSLDTDAAVEVAELTLMATFMDTPATSAADYFLGT